MLRTRPLLPRSGNVDAAVTERFLLLSPSSPTSEDMIISAPDRERCRESADGAQDATA